MIPITIDRLCQISLS